MKYDLLVIGAGSGGVRAARIAASYGKKVALFESDLVGGTCVIRGCVPKKLLVYASSFVKAMKTSKAFGWDVSQADFSWKKLIENKDNEIKRLNSIYHDLLDNSGVELVPFHGKINDENTVESNGKLYQGKHIIIATGAKPFFPEVKGMEHAISSNEALSLKEFPKKITVLGAGYIAVEFACIFNALGAEVNLIYRGDKILRGFDESIQDKAHLAFAKDGMNVITQAEITEIIKNDNSHTVKLSNGEMLNDQDQVLVAAGRVANTDNLGLTNVNLGLKPNGQIVVDKHQKTNVDSIFAVGDVCNLHNLTPVAIREGHLLVNRLFKGEVEFPDYDFIPTTVFSQPEIASCGYTEQQARDKFKDIKVFTSEFRAMKYAMSEVQDKTFMKMIVNQENDEVIGCHVLGADAGEMIQGLAIAMKQGLQKSALNKCIGIHPTSAEEFVTL